MLQRRSVRLSRCHCRKPHSTTTANAILLILRSFCTVPFACTAPLQVPADDHVAVWHRLCALLRRQIPLPLRRQWCVTFACMHLLFWPSCPLLFGIDV